MKKLLSLLGAIGLSFSASATVIACSNDSSQTQLGADNQKIIDGSSLKLDADGLLKIIEGSGDGQLITNGKPDEALKSFMNSFAYVFEKNFESIVKDKNIKMPHYANDNFPKAVTNIYNQLTSRANDAWDAQIRQKKNEFGKDYETKFLKELKETYDVDYTKIEDYKDNFVFRYATDGQGNTSIRDVLNLISDEFGKGSGFTTSDGTVSRIRTDLFNSEGTYGNRKVDFRKNANEASGIPTGVTREKTWFGQFDNYLLGLKDIKDSAEANNQLFIDSVSPLIQIINLTGGLEFEDWLKDHETNDPKNPNSFLVDDVKWATAKEIKEKVLTDEQNITEWSNKLVKRMDGNYNTHFKDNNPNAGKAIFGGIEELNAMGEISELPGTVYRSLFSSVPDLAVQQANEQLNGLFSNSQRYFANQYYAEKKPVAITEFVVKPLGTKANIGFDKEITNSPYVGTGSMKYIGLENFIKAFVTDSIPATDPSPIDHTKEMFDDESNFSWDVLLDNKGKLEDISHNGNENSKGSWTPQPYQWYELGKDLSMVEHSNLLTIDSTSYSNTLKYAVYDLLQNDSKTEWKDWDKDGRPKLSTNDFDYKDARLDAKQENAAKNITSFIHSIDRSGTTEAEGDQGAQADKNVYQLLNEKQGIIAFSADDGIHFARIEGYQLLKDQAKLLKEQNDLSIENFDDIKNFGTYYQFNAAINNNEGAASARAITYDYMNRDKYSQNQSKIKYEDLNKSFGNTYLEFLANTSILATRGDSAARYKYSLKREVQNWLSTTATTNDKYWVAVWDYAKLMLDVKTDEEVFDLFFVADTNENSLQNRYKTTILRILKQTRSRIKSNPSTSLLKQWETYQDTQLNLASNFNTDGIVYRPWNFISIGENAEKFEHIGESQLWQFESAPKPDAAVIYSFANVSSAVSSLDPNILSNLRKENY